MELKDRLYTRRKELGLTLSELAAQTGISSTTIMRYEHGDIKNMRQDKVRALADALQLSPQQLLGWKQDQTTEDPVQQKLLLLARKANQIPEQERNDMIRVFESSIDIYLKAKGIIREEE